MKSRPSKKKIRNTAFVVIHGIGEQSPFETLDSFAANLVKYLERDNIKFSVEHHIKGRHGANGGLWNESYVRLSPSKGDSTIDIHEFYWASVTEEKISVPEVWRWVEQTLAATKKFYRENEDLQRKFRERRHSRHFSLGWAAWLLRFTTIFYPLIVLVRMLLKLSGTLLRVSWIEGVFNWFAEETRWMIVGYLGDIAIYTTTDEKSQYYQIRQRILEECETFVEQILLDDSNDRVILAGHSLGSVIAYDTLNRLNIKLNVDQFTGLPVEKLAGLITFGSPLDKIAFFFREHTRAPEYIRRQILSHLHSFKSKNLDIQNDPRPVDDPLKHLLDGLPWVNYYSRKDPVSGHLDFYAIDDRDNVALTLPQSWGVAHIGYWTSEEFYGDIAKRFLS